MIDHFYIITMQKHQLQSKSPVEKQTHTGAANNYYYSLWWREIEREDKQTASVLVKSKNRLIC